MKYKKYTGIILRKQNYREADQILTIWTKEEGKVRLMGRGLRLPKSKLSYSVQDLSLAEIEAAGRGSIPTLIAAKPIRIFASLRQDLKKMAVGFYAAEMMMKMTADESPNLPAFELLLALLDKVDQTASSEVNPETGDLFALDLAEALGFGTPVKTHTHKDIREFIESLIERKIKSEPFLISI